MFSAEIKPNKKMSLAYNAAEPAIAPSPCNGVCLMGRDGFCLGCARTIEEIGAWSCLSASGRLAVMEKLAARKAAAASDSPI
jgi:predicted Fe-S protein YdhL (DUF1289 family)